MKSIALKNTENFIKNAFSYKIAVRNNWLPYLEQTFMNYKINTNAFKIKPTFSLFFKIFTSDFLLCILDLDKSVFY